MPTTEPLLPSAYTLFGHSLAANGGAAGNVLTRSWENMFIQMARGRLWSQAVGGAAVAKTNVPRGTPGWGGVAQVLQGLVPNPYNGINWRGPYVAATPYAYLDGVTSGGNWFVNESGSASNTLAPPASGSANGWVQVTAPSAQIGSSYTNEAALSSYPGHAFVPIFWFGTNDLGWIFNGNDKAFLVAMESCLAAACATTNYDCNHPMITTAGGVWTVNSYSGGNVDGIGSSFMTVPTTAGATATFTTPADWPGGYVDFRIVITYNAAGALAFTVDGAAVNIVTQGSSTGGNILTFPGTLPNQTVFYGGTALTAALAAGTAVTSIPVVATSATDSLSSGATIYIGPPGSQDSFVTSAAVAGGVTAIPVVSKAPTYAHAINDSVSTNQYNQNVTVRAPTQPGSHSVVATVQASPALGGVYLDGVTLESPNPPPVMVLGLPYMMDYNLYWSSRTQNDAVIDQWNADLQALVEQFPSAFYVDTTQWQRPGAKLATALTAGTATTSLTLQAPGLPYSLQNGDSVGIGSGVSRDFATASAPVPKGATTIPVTSFTPTYAHAVGQWAWGGPEVKRRTTVDGVHFSDYGHRMVAGEAYKALVANVQNLTPDRIAKLSSPSRLDVVIQRYQGANLTVGTGTASQWGRVGGTSILLTVPADIGDVLEVTLNGMWDAPATVIAGWIDVATWDVAAGIPINYFSGALYVGNGGTAGVGLDSVGAQATNGLPQFLSGGSSATQYDSITGSILYVVQPADIRGGNVNLVLYGKSSSTTTRIIDAASPNYFAWHAKNLGPMSYTGESV